MTIFSVIKKENDAVIEVKGHSEYAKYGEDIVCASISTLCLYTANLIDKLDLRYNILDLVCEEGYFRLQVKTLDLTTKRIFESLVEHLEELQGQYPKYIKKKN